MTDVQFEPLMEMKEVVKTLVGDPDRHIICVVAYNAESETFEAYIHGTVMNPVEISNEIIDILTENTVVTQRSREIN